MASLYFATGPSEGKSIFVGEQPISIGRAEENDIALEDVAVSFLHARIRLLASGVHLLEDLNSSNGTFVNNRRIDAVELAEEDRIRIGLNEFAYMRADEVTDIIRMIDSSVVVLEDIDSDRELQIVWVDEDPPEEQILYERERDSLRTEGDHAAFLVDVTRQLGRVMELEALLQETLRILCTTFKAERGFVVLFEQKGDQLVRKSVALYPPDFSGPTRLSRTLIDQVIDERKPILSYDASQDARFSSSDSVVEQRIRAMMVAPLQRGKELFGVVQIDSLVERGIFGREELELLSVICDEASVSIENARLTDQFKQMASYNNSILQGLAQGLIVVDPALLVTTVNRRAEQILGLAAASMEGRVLTNEVWLKPLSIEIQLAFEGQEARLHREIQLAPPGAAQLWVECSISLLVEENKCTGAVMLLLDLTERRRLIDATERSDRLAAMGRAVSGLTRRIQGPLATVSQALTELAEQLKSKRALRELIVRAEAGVAEAGQLAAELLGSIENTELLISEVLLEPLLRVALEDFAPQLETRGIQLVEKLGTVGKVQVDPDKLTQIVSHLVSNALDAMRDMGTLTVSTGCAPATPVRHERVWIEIADTGDGISTEVLPHIFDAFYSHKKDGAGLGLYLSHTLVKQLGGEIEVVSRPGQGTRLRISIPRS